jgi:alpha-tubulin suppressor-like RCC1 family protein
MVGSSSSTSTGGADMTFTTLNGNLAGLTASSGTLSPSFSPSIYSYRGAVDAAVSSVVVTPTTSDSNATVAVNGTPVVSGSSSSPLPLGYGDTTINIVVTASDNISTVTYTLIITRDAPSTLNAVFSSATDIPLVSNGMVATGDTINFTLNYTPTPGTSLTVVNNTGLGFIKGKYSNLAHGDVVNLTYNGVTYHFVANYYGGTGNDLVLTWAGTRVVAWGANSTSSTPMAVPATGTPLANHTVLALSAGAGFSLALFSDGTLASWGYNGDGELGNNTTTDTSTPGALATAGGPLVGKVVVAASSGYYHNLVLCSDGSMASWGQNYNGQLGNSAFPKIEVPVPVMTSGTPLASKSVVAIASGFDHNLVLCDDGTLAAWGNNLNGQLGNNPTNFTKTSAPVLVTITGTPLVGKTVVSIGAGQYYNIALCSDGTVMTWGINSSGQLGNSTTTSSSAPVAVSTSGALAGKTVTAVAAGGSHCLALCSDGTIAAWGNNAYGQLGNNTTTNSSVPVAVTTDGTPLAGKTIVRLIAGYYHSMVQCSDGTLVSWGDNGYGELGNSTVSSISSIPVAVDTSALASAESFVLANSGSSAYGCLGLVASPVPTVTTLAVTSVGATTAVLNGTVNANGGSSMVSFDYGLDNSYGTNLAGTPSSVTGTGSTTISTSLTSLTPSTTYHFRANGGSYSGSDLTFTTLSQLQNWRQQAFGTTTATGLMADTADFDGDGIPNLLEFALNLNPTAASALPVNGAVNGANYEYTYSRSSAAVNAGTSYQVQWSGTLPATWSSSGVTQVILTDDTTTQQVKAYVPMNGAATLFVHLSVTAPP